MKKAGQLQADIIIISFRQGYVICFKTEELCRQQTKKIHVPVAMIDMSKAFDPIVPDL